MTYLSYSKKIAKINFRLGLLLGIAIGSCLATIFSLIAIL
jgi:hypothetical protein